MNRPKVSVILPIYNAGDFLIPCLQSLVNQTLSEIEIICVLDCPTDGSDKIAKDFACTDARIKIVSNEKNSHIGISRNIGIELASGEYIGFIDNDDIADIDLYKTLYEKAILENDVVVSCGFKCFGNKNNENIRQEDNPNIHSIIANTLNGCEVFDLVVWTHIYKREFIKKYNIRFIDTNFISGEDGIFNYMVYTNILINNLKYSNVNKALYNWRMHNGSTGKTYLYAYNQISHFEFLCQKINEEKRFSESDRAKQRGFLLEGLIRLFYTPLRKNLVSLKFSSLRGILSERKRIKQFPNLCELLINDENHIDISLSIPKKIILCLLKSVM
jgi:glycosyltransferase involved in cell wall biosynthesis